MSQDLENSGTGDRLPTHPRRRVPVEATPPICPCGAPATIGSAHGWLCPHCRHLDEAAAVLEESPLPPDDGSSGVD